jgi:Flp pilus assembly protein TadG
MRRMTVMPTTMTRKSKSSEQGAMAVMIAVLMVALMGIAALVIDVGLVREERRTLQNGADAAALALAQDCAQGLCSGLQAKAETYANLNSADGTSTVSAVVVTGSSVRVDTRTRTSAGSNALTMQFAPAVGAQATSTVDATATASWFAPAGAQTLPLTFSYCEWNAMTSTGITFPSTAQTILFHDPKAPGNQNASPRCSGPAGQDMPGGFGWLDTISNTECAANIAAGGTYGAAPGNSPPNTNNSGCSPASFLNVDLLIPVFSATNNSGQNGQYQIYGLATFRITRMRLGGSGTPWVSSPPPPNCSNSERCIYGTFVRDIIPWTGGSLGGAPNLGTVSVRLTS